VRSGDPGVDLMYSRALVTIKDSINPSSGAMPATTNPYDYAYDVWARDSAVTAIALDAAGFTKEAGAYWSWLAARQGSDGRFATRFNLWDSSDVPFVQPEDDTVGLFLVGVRNHYAITGDESFLGALWPAYQRSASYLWSSLGSSTYGLGAEDFSIWEETYEYGVFSQAAYVAGLDAAQYVAVAMGRARSSPTTTRAPRARSARPSSATTPGIRRGCGTSIRGTTTAPSTRTGPRAPPSMAPPTP